MLNVVRTFNKSHKNIAVDWRTQPFNDYYQELSKSLATADAPNLWTADGADDLPVVLKNEESPFDKFIKANAVLRARNFPTALWRYYQWKGKQDEIPLYALPLMLFYNKTLLEQASYKAPVLKPAASVLKAARRMTHGSSQYGLVVPETWPMQFVWPTVLAQFGGKPFDSATKTSLVNSKAGVKALTFLHKLIYNYHVSPRDYRVDQDLSLLSQGQAAQILDGSWEAPSIRSFGTNFAYTQVPQFGPHHLVFIGDLGWSMYRNNSSAVDKAIVTFISYYEKHSNALAGVGDVPVYRPVLGGKGFASRYPIAFAASKQLNLGIYAVRYPNYDDSYVYHDAIWPVITGKSNTIKADLNAAAKAVTSHVRKGD